MQQRLQQQQKQKGPGADRIDPQSYNTEMTPLVS